MADLATARRWATAFLDLAAENNRIDELGAELSAVREAFTGPGLYALSNPVFTLDERRAALDAILSKGSNTIARGFEDWNVQMTDIHLRQGAVFLEHTQTGRCGLMSAREIALNRLKGILCPLCAEKWVVVRALFKPSA